MASKYRGASLLLFLLSCLLIIYVGRNWRKRFPDGASDPSLVGKQAVESSRLGKAGGVRADTPQFQFMNRVAMAFRKEAAADLQQLMARRAQSRDPQLIDVVRRLIDPPPTEGSRSLSFVVQETEQATEANALLNQSTNGFFVECGAYDGELKSNSLAFEFNRHWTGVLIEPNPYYYTQLLGKSRNVWSINACLSPYDYAIQVQLQSFQQEGARVVLSNDTKTTNFVVPCIPLETILLALNRTRVDYFSLDIEGLELEILKTIPFDRFDIRVLTVEFFWGASGKEAYKRFMESKGYRTHKEFTYEYVFVKQ